MKSVASLSVRERKEKEKHHKQHFYN